MPDDPPPPPAGGSRTSADRLARLLNLVPYLLARPGIEVAEAAGDLGVTERQLREDLELLWVCGLPGYGPGDLIDMAFDGDRVTITYDAGIDRPLRLTPDEALALVVALRMLAETPGVANRDAVERALAKIENAAGDLVGAPVAVRLPGEGRRVRGAAGRGGAAAGAADHLLHRRPGRDHRAHRRPAADADGRRPGVRRGVVPPRRGGPVVPGRPDRRGVELDEPAVVPPQARPHDLRQGVFRPSPDLPLITLRIGRGERWITEYYPCERVEVDGDRWVVSLRVTDLGWARRFVLGLGPDVTVVAPVELAAQVRAQATAALEAYATPVLSAGPAGPVTAR